MSKRVLIFLLFAAFSLQSFSQDRKVDVLELLYKQENYRSILRKTNRLIDKKGYDDNELVHLFKAVALAKLSLDDRYTRSNKDVLANSTDAYEVYYELDKQLGFQQKKSVLLSDLKAIYKNAKSVSIKSDAYDFLMKGDVKPKKVITKKEQVIIVKNETGSKVKYDEGFKAAEVDTTCTVDELSEVDKLIDYSKKFLGVPYIYGGTGDGGFDCSGYTQYIMGRYGYKIPRSARNQKEKIKPVKIKKAQKGDLVFFSKNKKKSNITHVGIVISDPGEDLVMIHASSSRGIMITNVTTNTYWKPKLVAVGRPEKEEVTSDSDN
ncbi:MAG: C40 family peptidase [Flavobacteriales bacterium]